MGTLAKIRASSVPNHITYMKRLKRILCNAKWFTECRASWLVSLLVSILLLKIVGLRLSIRRANLHIFSPASTMCKRIILLRKRELNGSMTVDLRMEISSLIRRAVMKPWRSVNEKKLEGRLWYDVVVASTSTEMRLSRIPLVITASWGVRIV